MGHQADLREAAVDKKQYERETVGITTTVFSFQYMAQLKIGLTSSQRQYQK